MLHTRGGGWHGQEHSCTLAQVRLNFTALELFSCEVGKIGLFSSAKLLALPLCAHTVLRSGV
jgi:hypothetical protein